MMNADQKDALLCIELASIAVGYRLIQRLTGEAHGQIRIIEASPAGDRFVILAAGPYAVLEDARTVCREALDSNEKGLWIDSELLPECPEAVVMALFHLSTQQALESVAIAEAESVCGLLVVARALAVSGVRLIELKIKRAGGGAYGFFTGPLEMVQVSVEDARTKLKRALREGRIEIIEAPSAGFREFFNLSGVT